MFTTGSKLLIGSAALATVLAVVYGIAQGGALGTIALISAAVALSLLAGLDLYVRDANVSAMDPDAFEASAAAQATARPTPWPLVVALGATTVTLGLVTSRAFFVIGLLIVIVGAIEWLVQGWSERASADERFNEQVREVMAAPLEMPAFGAVGAAIVVYAFSRVMLGLPSKSSTVVAFAALAALVLAGGTLIGLRRGVSKVAMTGAFSVAGIALVAVGAFAGLNGEREIEEHHSTGYLAEKNECGPEETEADEKASQTVAAKSNLAAELTFDGASLQAEAVGFEGRFDTLTLPRSNPANILFRNESDHPARLVIELHPDEATDAPERLCTALVEPDGVQLLTVEFDRPSIVVESGYAFTVPGSDASLEVVVP